MTLQAIRPGIRFPRPATLAALGAVTLPVGYVIQQHMAWERRPESKKRMLFQQLLFWGSAAGAVAYMHRILRRYQVPLIQRLPFFALAGVLPMLSFRYGAPLSYALFPNPEQAGKTGSGGRRYRPAYLMKQ